MKANEFNAYYLQNPVCIKKLISFKNGYISVIFVA